MPNLTTFGWEQEFQTGAEELARELHRRGLVRNPELHPYHCDCSGCMGSYPLHAQRDSSCSGEIISRVYAHGDLAGFVPVSYYQNAGEIFREVEEAAIAVDAEPGETSGFHVHVGTQYMGAPESANAFWAFLRWEPVLQVLASGRFREVRGANGTTRGQISPYLDSLCHSYGLAAVGRGIGARILAIEAYRDGFVEIKRMVLRFNGDCDRHSNLNTRTHRETFEYRLWNSTRSAWRCDLFTRLTVALVDPEVVYMLNEHDVPSRGAAPVNADTLCSVLDDAGHTRAAELARRQFDYATRTRDSAELPLAII